MVTWVSEKSRSGGRLGQGPVCTISVMIKSQSCSGGMHRPLPSTPFLLPRATFLVLCRKTGLLAAAGAFGFSACFLSSWDLGRKHLVELSKASHASQSGKTDDRPGGGTELRAGLGLKEVFSDGGRSGRLWGPGRWPWGP